MQAFKPPRQEAIAQSRAGGMKRGASTTARLSRAGWRTCATATMRCQAGLRHTMLNLATPEERMIGACAREARMARLEALRLNDLLALRREDASYAFPRAMTEEELMAKQGALAPMPA